MGRRIGGVGGGSDPGKKGGGLFVAALAVVVIGVGGGTGVGISGVGGSASSALRAPG